MSVNDFYDKLSPFYHFVYTDWEASVERQAQAIDSIIRDCWGGDCKTILDAACGIGTQSLGLAQLGYEVAASDLSPEAIQRAEREAADRGLDISFSVADMRQLFEHHRSTFDVVIACDNAVPHLLSDDELLTGLRQFYQCTRPGGGCLITVRDYEKEELEGTQVKPHGVRYEGGRKYLVFQVWEFQGCIYDVSLYFVEDRGGETCQAHVMRTQYYAVTATRLRELMAEAGYEDVHRIDDKLFQAALVGTKPL